MEKDEKTREKERRAALCHQYVTIVFRPLDYKECDRLDLFEFNDEVRIRLHKELCEAYGVGRDVVEHTVEKAGWKYGVDPRNDPYFDLSDVSDEFFRLMEEMAET